MALTDAAIIERVRIAAKDATSRFTTQIGQYLVDTCREVSTAPEFNFLLESKSITVPTPKTGWVALDAATYQVQDVTYEVDGRIYHFEYVSEDDYFYRNYENTQQNTIGHYRLRWNPASISPQWEIALVNGPEPGVTINTLIRKWLSSSAHFPDYMEEVLYLGTLARTLKFLEGDDLDVAIMIGEDYITKTKQHYKFGDQFISKRPRRAKTLQEVYQSRINQYRG